MTLKFDEVFSIMKKSFPQEEMRNYEGQKALLERDDYFIKTYMHEDEVAGFCANYKFDNFIYIEHLAVHPEVRGQKIGTKVLHELRELQKTLILEIDPPVDNISIKRLHFYENVGFKLNDYPHVHPAYRLEYKGHELKVLSYPQGISLHVFKIFRQYLNDTVMKYSER